MRAVKSRAAKQNIGLTVPQATRQARAVVDQLMPGQGVTVESRRSHDTDTDTPTIITHITFPRMHPALSALREALVALTGQRDTVTATCSITITRTAAR